MSLIIDKIKILYGNNLNLKYKIINEIKRAIEKDKSEYSEFIGSKVYYNEELLNSNEFEYYTITNNIDFESEFKLNSKSLLIKYLENKLKNIEYDERFATLKILLEDMCNEYINPNANIILKDSNINFEISDFNLKQLIKLINPIILSKELEKNFFDLNYNEIIEYQLIIINEISKISNKKIIIFIDCNIDCYIYNMLKELDSNISCIILNNVKGFKYENYLLVNNLIIDLYNKEENMDYFQEKLNYYIDICTYNRLLTLYFNDYKCKEIIEFKKII